MPPPADQASRKRKQPPTNGGNNAQKRRFRGPDPRIIATQTSGKAFTNGEIDVDKFVKAREFEIKALEEGLKKSKKALSRRAFQDVPKDMRRRTASHNVKRVPKRLRARAAVEMAEDNTPTVTARRRKPSPHMRLRLETAKRLKALSSKVKAKAKAKAKHKEAKDAESMDVTVTAIDPPTVELTTSKEDSAKIDSGVKTRRPRAKKAMLKSPPVPPAKFRKRQIYKTWLPTHPFHTKRAHMTPPKEPLWRFALPLTPTTKSYRPTHRASGARGAIAWDTSYMSTLGLHGQESSIQGLLQALGVGADGDPDGLWARRGQRWRDGKRTWDGWVYEREGYPTKAIAPVTIIWCAKEELNNDARQGRNLTAPRQTDRKDKRKVFIRIHPSAFHRLWEEVLRLSKVQKPAVTVEDLRFEIGSIEVLGPGSSEALVGALWPTIRADGQEYGTDSPESVWPTLSTVANPACLPANALLAFDMSDPRLHHPPRTVKPSQPDAADQGLARVLTGWPPDRTHFITTLFDRNARLAASRSLPSQKSINRRKAQAMPGAYPDPVATDPKIPVLLYTSRHADRGQASWTVLMPWKCVLPVWYSTMYYPLSTGGNVRFGGLREKRQVTFEAGEPWFPGDYPGTKAGDEWEMQEREKRKEEWGKRPKGKRPEWSSVNLGDGRKGEIGVGWACDWQRLLRRSEASPDGAPENLPVHHLTRAVASDILTSTTQPNAKTVDGALFTVRLTLITRGVPTTCARIYRLPTTNPELRAKWLALLPSPASKNSKNKTHALLPPLPKDAPPHLHHRRLAASLLAPPPPQPGNPAYPIVPDEADLIGFVTTGNYNLGEGRGTGIGCLLLSRVLLKEGADEGEGGGEGGGETVGKGTKEGEKVKGEERLCIVREAGQGIGRLARWEVV